MMSDYQQAEQCIVSRSRLANVLRGSDCPRESVSTFSADVLPDGTDALIIWTPWSNRPSCVVIADNSQDEFFAWLTAYHDDLTPISTWCHLFTATEWRRLCPSGTLFTRLDGLEAAWVGAIIADAMTRSEYDLEKLSLTSCLSTTTFSIARAVALNGFDKSIQQLAYNGAIQLLKPDEIKTIKNGMRGIVFDVLSSMRTDASNIDNVALTEVRKICRQIDLNGGYKRENSQNIDASMRVLFEMLPGFESLNAFSSASAEDYVRLLRNLQKIVAQIDEGQSLALTFVAGFVISQLGGAERDFRLAQQFGKASEDVLLWSAMLGGVGAEAFWSSGFGGLGRLVARELTRPFRFSDHPNCDISFLELTFLEKSEGETSNSIRTANRNILSVGVQAGVLVNLNTRARQSTSSLVPETTPASSKHEVGPFSVRTTHELNDLANQLLPFLLPQIKTEVRRITSKKTTIKSQESLKLK